MQHCDTSTNGDDSPANGVFCFSESIFELIIVGTKVEVAGVEAAAHLKTL